MGQNTPQEKQNFPPTQWSRLLALRDMQDSAGWRFIDSLATAYWRPLRDYLTARGFPSEDAADLVQGFISHAVQSGLFASADPARGSFRGYLLACLRNFAEKERRRAMARRRRPEGGFVSLEEAPPPGCYEDGLTVAGDAAERKFHQQWLHTLVEQVLRRLQSECLERGRTTWFALFHTWVVLPELEGMRSPPLLELARRHGLTPKAAANAVVTMKRAFRRLMMAEIAAYANTESDAAEEASAVLALLGLREAS